MPFGESMADQRITASYSSSYTFTGKEQDALTGLHYFGARYYDAKISLWYGVDPMAEEIPNQSAYNYVYNNPIRFLDQHGLYGEEGEATKAQESAVDKYGKDRVGDVYFNKNKNEYAFQIFGEDIDKYEHNDNEGVVAFKPDVSVYNNDQYYEYSDKTDRLMTINSVGGIADAFGAGSDLKEGLIEQTQKIGSLGKSGENYLKYTKIAGKLLGATSAITSSMEFYENPTTANAIKATMNIALAFARVNPLTGAVIGILDVTGATDALYNSIGNSVDKIRKK
ncbi:MAG: RHS repeat-associated core domain-containing protein [Saprospiraceae bacterium]|nr:RHS repeat-associated core domain-containing protein [Saprospiraceae bacterium]